MNRYREDLKVSMGGNTNEEATKNKIFDFILSNDDVNEQKLSEYARTLSVEYEDVMECLIKIIRETSSGVGKHNFVPDDKYNKGQLAIGIRIELEHTNSKVVAKNIAKDHLAEIPDYYSRLIIMESNAKKEK